MEPGTGRFVSEDPVNGNPYFPLTCHKYLYANNSPMTFNDPSGKFGGLIGAMMTSILQSTLRTISVIRTVGLVNYVVTQVSYHAAYTAVRLCVSNAMTGTGGAFVAQYILQISRTPAGQRMMPKMAEIVNAMIELAVTNRDNVLLSALIGLQSQINTLMRL